MITQHFNADIGALFFANRLPVGHVNILCSVDFRSLIFTYTFLSRNTPDTLSQFFHLLCTIRFNSYSPTYANINPRYLNVFALFTETDIECIQTMTIHVHVAPYMPFVERSQRSKISNYMIGLLLRRWGTWCFTLKPRSHSLIWRPVRVSDTPPLVPISWYDYCLGVVDVSLCSEVVLGLPLGLVPSMRPIIKSNVMPPFLTR